ncbi:MAG: FAD-dependent oxidoreductase, partial [Pyrinomonadaceae bacterium]
LSTDLETNVCVVGAGIAGLTTAYLLSKAGEKVIVIDDGAIGGGESGRTTAHLSNAIDDRFYKLEKLRGEENSRLAATSHAAAIDKIEQTAREEEIDCDFARVDGYLFEPPEGDQSELDKELTAAKRAGASVEMVERAPIQDFDTGRAIRFARQGQFHIFKYLNGLARAIEQNGGQLFSNTKAWDWTGGEAPTVEIADGKKIRAKAVVLATNYPLKSQVHFKQAAYRTYVVGVKVPKGAVAKALFWDTEDPYHYTRIQEENDYDVAAPLRNIRIG